MRVLLCLLILSVSGAASAEPQAALRHPAPVRPLLDAHFTAQAQREAEASAARQNRFDRHIAERSARAARSICDGCGPAGRSVGTVTPPGVRLDTVEAGSPPDPAEAPLD